MSTLDWWDLSNQEPVAPSLDDYPDHPLPDAGWGEGSDQETGLFLSDYGGRSSPLAGACIRGG